MLAGIANATKQAVQQQQRPPAPRKWSTRFTQWSSEPALLSECCAGLFCLPCATAAAKTRADGTNPCYNFMCWGPCGTYNYVRHEYNIEGVCGDDMCWGILCPCLGTRQLLTETRLSGPAMVIDTSAANNKEWDVSLFDCDFCSLLQIILCPCATSHMIREKLQPAGADSCCFDCLCTVPCGWYGQVRHEYGIVTDFPVCEDVLVPLICYPCAMNRARQQASRPKPRGHLVAPRPAAGMAYSGV